MATNEIEVLRQQNAELLAALRKITGEWTRQKGLFPILEQDGWMDLAVSEAEHLMRNQEAASPVFANDGREPDWGAYAEAEAKFGQSVAFMGVDPLNIAKGAVLPMIPDSWRFGFYKSGDDLRFGYLDNGPLVAWDAVKSTVATLDRSEFEQFCDHMIDGTDTVSRDWLFHFCTTLLARRAAAGHQS